MSDKIKQNCNTRGMFLGKLLRQKLFSCLSNLNKVFAAKLH